MKVLSIQRLMSTLIMLLSTKKDVKSLQIWSPLTVSQIILPKVMLMNGAKTPKIPKVNEQMSKHLNALVSCCQQFPKVIPAPFCEPCPNIFSYISKLIFQAFKLLSLQQGIYSAHDIIELQVGLHSEIRERFACQRIYNIIIKAIESMNFTEQVMKHEAYSQTDIVKKCKKYPQFYQQLVGLEGSYFNDLNMSIYADLQDVEFMEVFHLEQRDNIYINFYGYLMPPFEELTSKFYLLWIRMLDELLRSRLGKKYTVIYYHTICESNVPYNFLFNIYKKLPIYYYAMLDKIYTVDATYFVKKSASMFQFGRLNKLFERKIEHIQKLSEFANLTEIVKNGLLEQLPEKLMLVLQQKTKKKLMKNGNLMAYHQSLPVYASPPKKDYLTVDLNSYKLDNNGIPIPLQLLLNTLTQNKQFLQLEGIFRKSGSIEEEEQIIEELSKMGEGQSFKKVLDYSGFSYAGVVKKFFTKLINPIVPYEIYDRIMMIISNNPIKEQEQMDFMLDFIGDLPDLNRRIIMHLLIFLKEEVISRQQLNKMSNYNMAVCFFPCIFKSKTISEIDLINSGKFVGILKIFFTRFEQIVKEVGQMSTKNKDTPSTATGINTLKDFRMSMA